MYDRPELRHTYCAALSRPQDPAVTFPLTPTPVFTIFVSQKSEFLSPPLIAFRYIQYIEGKESIEFQADPGLKTPTVIYVPSPERWNSEIPEWAKHRRDEILARIQEKTLHIKPEFTEY